MITVPYSSGFDLREGARLLQRRWRLIAAVFITGMLFVGLLLHLIPPRYTAVATVMVDPRTTNVLNLDEVLSSLPANAETVQSEIEVLRAPALAGRVIDKLELLEQPAFLSTLASESRAAAIDFFLERLNIRAVGRSRVIAVRFTHEDPRLAAEVVNTLSSLYLADQADLRISANRDAAHWLNEKRTQLQAEAESAEETLARFRAEHKLISPNEVAQAARSPERAGDLARLTTLELEAAVSRDLYDTFLKRYQQTSQQDGWKQADARLVSAAEVPLHPSFPDRLWTLVFSFLGFLGLGLIVALIVEKLDNGFRSSDEVEAALGVASVALIPNLSSLSALPAESACHSRSDAGASPSASGKSKASPKSSASCVRIEDIVLSHPHGAFAESVRNLRLSLLLSDVDKPPKIVQVTSSLPGEGKTSLSIALARSAAQAGSKVLLIDGDLRCPRVQSAFNLPKGAGLLDLLEEKATLAQVLRRDPMMPEAPEQTGEEYLEAGDGGAVDLLPAGRSTPNAADLMRSDVFKSLLAELRESYDLVIIDSPPVIPVADARVFSLLVDSILFVVKWAVTPERTVVNAVRQLREVRTDAIAGVVLNNVDVQRHALYAYSDSGLYSRKYQKYYGA